MILLSGKNTWWDNVKVYNLHYLITGGRLDRYNCTMGPGCATSIQIMPGMLEFLSIGTVYSS